jgi:2-polyprenyl-3-methyl-5-hydroxy-6-metoxy-1,4-benzoquinol methylase
VKTNMCFCACCEHNSCFYYVAVACCFFQPGGSIFITTLNRTFSMWAFGIVLAEYVLRLLPRGTHQLNKCATPHEAEALLEKCEYSEA